VFGVTADTNIFISALVFGGVPQRFLEAARRGQFRLDLSPAILAETLRVLAEKFGWSQPMLDMAERRLSEIVAIVHPTITIDAVPADPDDNGCLSAPLPPPPVISSPATVISSGSAHTPG
jgi:predicted nucleic acid-binding protein